MIDLLGLWCGSSHHLNLRQTWRTPPTPPRRRCGLDRQGWIQAMAGLVIALIALLSSYDHISLPAGAKLQLPQ